MLEPTDITAAFANVRPVNVPTDVIFGCAAVVTVPAVVAAPLSVAVIVPAAKLPLASLATTLLAVLADVASTAIVFAVPPLKLVPVKYYPNVNVCVVFAVIVAEPPSDIAVPLTVN